MPGLVTASKPPKKQKRKSEGDNAGTPPKKVKTDNVSVEKIKEIEDSIQQSQKNFNQIATLLSFAREDSELSRTASVALCRVFSRLISQDRLAKAQNASKNEAMVSEWLRQRYAEFKTILSGLVGSDDSSRQELGLTLSTQALKVELESATSLDSAWRSGVFRSLVRAVLESRPGSSAYEQFDQSHYRVFDDMRFHTFTSIAEDLEKDHATGDDAEKRQHYIQNGLALLSTTPRLPADGKLNSFFHKPPKAKDSKQKMSFTKVSSHQKQAQRAWMVLLGSGLTTQQRKSILQNLTSTVVPSFQEPMRLMDFLTDSFNEGGSMALLALSGMFEMMTTCNLDYPLFYNKLYSLLDDDILHSAHRSRFFRLLNQFLSSTHVPAAMIASFIKKLSRLALHAPPAAIVAVVPLAYNLLYEHRTCTFMIHREMRTDEERELTELEGAEDPFDGDEENPMETSAIDSSLWELHALESHYHPNVSSLAGIVGQQFTKPSYNLEDFLDHSYGALVSSELRKAVKKAPVVEFEIPKKVFVSGEGDTSLGQMMQQIMASK